MDELVEHNCPVEGEIMVEKDKPCNWCDELDEEKEDASQTTNRSTSTE